MATALREVTSESVGSTRRAFIVVGMHRSGTSAMTRTLSLLGASLPVHLMEPAEANNETGFWEPQSIADLNDEILEAVDSEWDDVFSFRPRQYLSNFDNFYLGRAVELLEEEFSQSELIVLKDPRISVLSSFWDRALRRAGYATHYVIMVRNPVEVAESLRARDGFPREKSLLLWSSYMVALDRDTRNRPRTFVSYDQLLSDWRGVSGRIQDNSRVPLPRDTAMASVEIDRYLEHRLRHYRATPDDLLSADIPDHTRRLYRIFIDACDGAEVDHSAIDQIEAELDNIDALVGPVLADLKARSRAVAKELEEAKQDRDAATARCGSLESELEAERSRLSEELEERKRELADLAGRLVAGQAEREHLTAAALAERARIIAEAEAERARILEQERAERDRIVSEIAADRDRAIDRAEALEREISELAERTAAIEADRDRIVRETEEESRGKLIELQRLETVLDELRSNLSAAEFALDAERAASKAAAALLAAREAELTDELRAAQESASEVEVRLGERFREIAALTGELRQKHGEVVRAEQALADKEAELQSTLQQSQSDRESLERRLDERFREAATFGRMLADQEARNRQAREDAEWVRQVSALLLVESRTWKGRLRALLPAALHYKRQQKLLKRHGLFDGENYLAANSDVAANGVDPLRHYLRHGIIERRPRD
jgi:hypothetical protein